MRSASPSVTLPQIVAALLAIAAISAPPIRAQAQARRDAQGAWGGKTNGLGRYAAVNGFKLYYETHGRGKPLILLHGGLGAIEMFGPNLPALAKGRKVIAVDLQGHGRTADIDRPISVELMADDIAALIEHLKLERPDLMGYSLGGVVALQTAIRHPEVVGKLVVVSAPFRRSGYYPDILAQQGQVNAGAAEAMKQTPMYQLYASIAPRPEDFPRLLDKIGETMKHDFDFSAQIAGIKATTLIVAADADIFPPAHAVELFGLLGGGQRDPGWDGSGRPSSRLAILPGLTHYNIFSAPALAATAIPFLDEPTPKGQRSTGRSADANRPIEAQPVYALTRLTAGRGRSRWRSRPSSRRSRTFSCRSRRSSARSRTSSRRSRTSSARSRTPPSCRRSRTSSARSRTSSRRSRTFSRRSR